MQAKRHFTTDKDKNLKILGDEGDQWYYAKGSGNMLEEVEAGRSKQG